MSATVKKWLFRILLVSFCATLVWWVFYLPYDEKAVLRAIPDDSDVVLVRKLFKK